MEEFSSFLEDPQRRNKTIVALLGFLFLIFVGIVFYLVGIPSVLILVVIVCLLIVLGCTFAFIKFEKTENEAVEDLRFEEAVESILPVINPLRELNESTKQKIKACRDEVNSKGYHVGVTPREQLDIVTAIQRKIADRLAEIDERIESLDQDRLIGIPELVEQPIVFSGTAMDSLLDQKKLPDLPRPEWENTIDTLISQVMEGVRAK